MIGRRKCIARDCIYLGELKRNMMTRDEQRRELAFSSAFSTPVSTFSFCGLESYSEESIWSSRKMDRGVCLESFFMRKRDEDLRFGAIIATGQACAVRVIRR